MRLLFPLHPHRARHNLADDAAVFEDVHLFQGDAVARQPLARIPVKGNVVIVKNFVLRLKIDFGAHMRLLRFFALVAYGDAHPQQALRLIHDAASIFNFVV